MDHNMALAIQELEDAIVKKDGGEKFVIFLLL